jgi:hypothetical protein
MKNTAQKIMVMVIVLSATTPTYATSADLCIKKNIYYAAGACTVVSYVGAMYWFLEAARLEDDHNQCQGSAGGTHFEYNEETGEFVYDFTPQTSAGDSLVVDTSEVEKSAALSRTKGYRWFIVTLLSLSALVYVEYGIS